MASPLGLTNPSHTYANNGSNYIISLAATDSNGCSDFMTKSFYAAYPEPIASFGYEWLQLGYRFLHHQQYPLQQLHLGTSAMAILR